MIILMEVAPKEVASLTPLVDLRNLLKFDGNRISIASLIFAKSVCV